MSLLYILTIFYMALCTSAQNEQSWMSTVRPLPNGLVMRQAGTLRKQGGVWQVLLHYNAPAQDIWQATVTRLTALLDAYTQTVDRRQNETFFRHYREIQQIVQLHHPSVTHRGKRAWFGFLGEGLRVIAGTATEEQVNTLKGYVQQVHDEQANQRTFVDSMVTVVNQNQELIQQNRRWQQDTSTLMNNIQTHMRTLQNELDRITSILRANRIDFLLHELISRLQTQTLMQNQQEALFQRLRSGMEMGYLTEDMFPIELLQYISQNLPHGYYLVDPVWYYEHVKVKPLFMSNDEVTCVAELPLVTVTTYLRYQLSTWYVPRNGTDRIMKLVVPTEIGLDSTNGNLLQIQYCTGRDTRICLESTYQDKSFDTCFKGLISKSIDLVQSCPITVSTNNFPGITRLGNHHMVLQTNGERIVEHCVDQHEKWQYLDQGVYLLDVPETCSLSGDNWEFVPIRTFYNDMRFNLSQIFKIELDIPFLNLTSIPHLDQIPAEYLAPLPLSRIVKLDKMPTIAPWTWTEYQVPHISLIAGGGLLAIVITIIIIALCCKLQRCMQFRNLLHGKIHSLMNRKQNAPTCPIHLGELCVSSETIIDAKSQLPTEHPDVSSSVDQKPEAITSSSSCITPCVHSSNALYPKIHF